MSTGGQTTSASDPPSGFLKQTSASDPPSSTATAKTLLGLAAQRLARPVDELIRRMRQRDGESWLNIAVPTCASTSPEELASLLGGTASLAEMSACKERAKKQIAIAPTMDHALASLAVYCLSVAAALAHHDVCISTQSREQWDEIFIDLSECVPAAWREVLLKAAMRE